MGCNTRVNIHSERKSPTPPDPIALQGKALDSPCLNSRYPSSSCYAFPDGAATCTSQP